LRIIKHEICTCVVWGLTLGYEQTLNNIFPMNAFICMHSKQMTRRFGFDWTYTLTTQVAKKLIVSLYGGFPYFSGTDSKFDYLKRH